MGRQENPVDPGAGPVQRFAYEMRKLRQEAGGITYRAMARDTGYSLTTVSRAAASEQLPSLPVTLAYAAACGGDGEEWSGAGGPRTRRQLPQRWLPMTVISCTRASPGSNWGTPSGSSAGSSWPARSWRWCGARRCGAPAWPTW